MRFFQLFVILITGFLLTSIAFAEEEVANDSQNKVGIIYFLPSDRTAQTDIDSNIDTLIKATQTFFADMMEENGYGRKTFTLDTDDENVIVNRVTGKYTDAHYESTDKSDVWDEIKEAGFDPSQNIYIAFLDLSSEMIDGWCGTGGDWLDGGIGGVATLPASGDCLDADYGVTIAAHELGHAFGLRHDYRNHPDLSIDLATEDDPMVTSACAAEWLNEHRYFNSGLSSSTETTTIEMSTPITDGSGGISFSFTITDADGLHLAHFFNFVQETNYDDLSLLACHSISGNSTTTTFSTTTSVFSEDSDSVALRVMDDVGHTTEKAFSIDITTILSKSADVNGDGSVNNQDLVQVASKFRDEGNIPEDVNNDGIVNIIDLSLVSAAINDTGNAPMSRYPNLNTSITHEQVQQWLSEAKKLDLADPTVLRGISVLESLLALFPKNTQLLPNYPNPFNPETWIPYKLATSADVNIWIHASDGKLVRTLILGHKPTGIYFSRSRAAYWDGKNELGESVANGVYFYTLSSKGFTATRKMLILK